MYDKKRGKSPAKNGKEGDCVRKLAAFLLALWLLPGAALAELAQSELLDTAFSMLEETNPFVARYEAATGAEVDTLFPLGVPYFFGGVSYSTLVYRYPNYYVERCNSNTIYYRDGQKYFYGFDCAGFVRWVMMQCRRINIGTIAETISYESHMWNYHLYCTCAGGTPMPDWKDLPQTLEVGDILAGKHGRSYHIMLYIGTLRDYGYTTEDFPELEGWLDNPLVIHSSAHPAFGERFDLLRESDPIRYGDCATTDGGVAISILGVPWDSAPNHSNYQMQNHAWFELENDCLLTLINFDSYTRYCWYRR